MIYAVDCSNREIHGGRQVWFPTFLIRAFWTYQNESLFLVIFLSLLIQRQAMLFHRKQVTFVRPQSNLIIHHMQRPSLGFSITCLSNQNSACTLFSLQQVASEVSSAGRINITLSCSSDLPQIIPKLFWCFFSPWRQKEKKNERKKPFSKDLK